MDTSFDFPLRRYRLYDQIAQQIQDLIVAESLHPNQRLPSERDLAERLGVSRTVVREATRILGVRGLVRVVPGSGTYVQALSPRHAAAPIELFLKMRPGSDTFDSLCEVRRTLEIEIAGLAAQRATAADLADLETALRCTVTHAEDAEQFVQYDLDFHSALAAATHNDLYGVLLSPIVDLLLEFRLASYYHDRQGAIRGGIVYHRAILDRVIAGDEAGARQAMRAHLDQAERLFKPDGLQASDAAEP